MKKFGFFSALMMLVIFVGMHFMKLAQVDTDITAEKTKVGFIMNGPIDDHSWGEAHYNGMQKTAEELNLEVIYCESTPENEGCLETLQSLADQDCEIIIADSFGYGEQVLEFAKDHPDIYFFHATGVTTANNVSTYFGRIYQMRYLSGIVAGLQTDSNEIGYVAAFNMSEVNRGINAFALGVRSVNPNAHVYVRFINDWIDYEKVEYATKELVKKHPGIDVMGMHTDSTAALDVCDAKGIYSIGYNIDNSAIYPNTFLTAPVWSWENFYTPNILSCLQGKYKAKQHWEGIESGILDLAPLTSNVKSGTAERVEAARKRIENGTTDVFYGPIYDNKGNLRIADGESMTDEVMLNSFDWFVEGVVIDEED